MYFFPHHIALSLLLLLLWSSLLCLGPRCIKEVGTFVEETNETVNKKPTIYLGNVKQVHNNDTDETCLQKCLAHPDATACAVVTDPPQGVEKKVRYNHFIVV